MTDNSVKLPDSNVKNVKLKQRNPRRPKLTPRIDLAYEWNGDQGWKRALADVHAIILEGKPSTDGGPT